MSGSDVLEMQKRLNQVWGFRVAEDGSYDSDDESMITNYQIYYSVSGDQKGTYGSTTRRDLEGRTRNPK
ncbi:MAG TPA: hypothetical protein DEQ61_11945 [Streptomyces sp.]|nr:hypothetical protein [Streptomyces sp.]